MPLNDLIKNYSINTISQKTNISIEVLDKLINRDWENLQRAKVNGFLNIIERDFEIELNELREEANSYYQEHKVASSNRPIDLVDSQSVGGGGSKILGNILTIATLGLISYATWFYFIKPSSSVNSDDKNSSGLIKDSIKSAKELVGEVNKSKNLVGEVNKSKNNENNISKNRDLTQLKDSKSSNNTIDRVVTIVERNTTEVKQVEEQNSSKKFDITANVGAESNISTNNINSNEVNLSVDSNSSIKDRVEKIIDESNSSSDLNSSVRDDNSSVTANNNTNTELNSSENINEVNSTQDSEVKAEDSLNAIESAKIVLKSKRLWLGEYNIDTKRKNSRFLKGSYNLNIDSGKIVLTSGHCQYSIVTNKKTINLSKLKKCYVLVSKEDGVKIITKNEYKTLTKRRAW